jgi:hypothetical protein
MRSCTAIAERLQSLRVALYNHSVTALHKRIPKLIHTSSPFAFPRFVTRLISSHPNTSHPLSQLGDQQVNGVHQQRILYERTSGRRRDVRSGRCSSQGTDGWRLRKHRRCLQQSYDCNKLSHWRYRRRLRSHASLIEDLGVFERIGQQY